MRTVAYYLLTCISFFSFSCSSEKKQKEAEVKLSAYRQELDSFRNAFGGCIDMPDIHFFLFGMGDRTKLLYKDGVLKKSLSGEVIKEWKVKKDIINPSDYSVYIKTIDGEDIVIMEDSSAVYIIEEKQKTAVTGTETNINLPDFNEYRFPQILKVIHQEILVNINDGLPVPNYFVYKKPWYRDGAMMAMCLKETKNLRLIKNWVMNISDPYDHNNGEDEGDNLGQMLYTLSLVADEKHPIVAKIQKEFKRWEAKDITGIYIKGRCDGAEHPMYQTKWAKFGLRALGLNDPYTIPKFQDSYSALFWMDFKDQYVQGNDASDKNNYAYLDWASDHFHGVKKSPVSNRDYPLTWERQASAADYKGMAIIDKSFVDMKLSVPHTWHAAEIFLYLITIKK